MRVSGSKQRVVLSEVDLEHREAKPTRRVAPWAAALAWCGSIGIATAIYLEWLPARSLFTPSGSEAGAAQPRVVPPRIAANSLKPAGDAPLQQGAPASVPQSTPAPEPAADLVREVERASASNQAATEDGNSRHSGETGRMTRSRETPESTRVIRGSYHSDHTHWVGGW